MCGAIHFALGTKVLSGEQYLYLTVTALLLVYRLVRPYLKRARGKGPAAPPRVHATTECWHGWPGCDTLISGRRWSSVLRRCAL